MSQIINSFTKGLDMDTNPIQYSNEHYYYAQNLRLIVDDELSSFTLTNGKGLKLIIATYDFSSISSNFQIIGGCEIDDSLILFARNSTNGYGTIYKIPVSDLENPTTVIGILELNYYVLVAKQFNFGPRVKCISRIEKGNVRKIYWVDGINPTRVLNIDDTSISSKDVEEFYLIRRSLLGTPSFTSIIAGNLSSGMYRYAYCLFDINGSETSYSDLSQYIPLSPSDLVSDTSSKNGWVFKGGSSEDNSNKGIQITINKNTTLSSYQNLFDNIRIVRIYYSTQIDIPTVTIVYEGSNEDSVIFNDTGVNNLGTLAYEEFVTKNPYIVPKTIETKNDYLFLGNTTTTIYDVDYDARAYRFNSTGQGKLFNASTGVIQWDVSTDGYSVPETYDCQNNFNLIERDNYTGNTGTIRPAYEDCKYKADGVTLGGQGINISYTFVTTNMNFSTGTTYYLNPEDYQYIGYQRDEIYRFGIILYNKYGENSFVKWIGDVRFPTTKEIPLIFNNTYVNPIGIKFTVTNLPSDCTGYQIVRLPRNNEDQTVIDCGYVGHLYSENKGVLYSSTAVDLFISTDSDINHRPKLLSSAVYPSIVEYMCGETNYNKNNNSNYNRIDIYTSKSNSIWLRRGTLSHPKDADNAVLSYIYPYSNTSYPYYNAKKVKYIKTTGTFLYNAVRDLTTETPLPAVFGPNLKISSQTYSSGNRGLKGTSLFLKLYSDLTTVDDGGTLNYPGYSLRRKHVKGYGGFGYNARKNNEYITCSPIIPYTTSTINVFGGDTFITWFEYNRICWYEHTNSTSMGSDRLSHIVRGLVESKINFTYSTSSKMTNYTQWNQVSDNLIRKDYSYLAMWETLGSWSFFYGDSGTSTLYFVQDFDMYTYNPTYSTYHYENTLLPKPIYYNSETSYPVRVYKSLKKINGELYDNWSKIYSNNYKDLDSKYGELVSLKVFNNNLYAFQPNGIAVLAVEDREVIQSNNTSALAIGTGGVIERYDYISNNSGTNFETSIVNTNNNIYYIDDRNKKICLLTNTVQFISDLKGLMSYTSNKDYDYCATLYNPKFSEVWFNIDGETAIYNEYAGMFTSTLETDFLEGIQAGNGTFCYSDIISGSYTRTNFCKLDSGYYGAYNSTTRYSLTSSPYWRDIPSSTSIVKFIVNPNNGTRNRFDNLELINFASVNGTDYSSNITFTDATFKTQYQISTINNFYSNAKRKFRVWRLNTFRGSSNDRLHDNFMKVELTYDPTVFSGISSNIKFNLNTTAVNFIPTFIR